MSLKFKDVKHEKLDHFFLKTKYEEREINLQVDVVANKRLYINDVDLDDTLEEFLNKAGGQCYREMEKCQEIVS